MFNSQIDNVQREQVMNSEPKPIDPTSSPAIANTLVVRSPCLFGKFKNDEIFNNPIYNSNCRVL